MAEPVLKIRHGEHVYSFRGLTAKEMAKVQTETGIKTRREFHDAITDEDPNALIAAIVLARTRAGESVRWDDVDLVLEDIEAGYYDDADREVEPVFETNDDGSLALVDDDGEKHPVTVKDERGRTVWRYVDNGEPVPPTDSAETTPSPDTKPTSGSSTESIPSLSIA